MNIAGLSKAQLLAALFNYAMPPALRFMSTKSEPMTTEQADRIIKQMLHDKRPLKFDSIEGRSLNIDLSSDETDPTRYNLYNGRATAEHVVASLRA